MGQTIPVILELDPWPPWVGTAQPKQQARVPATASVKPSLPVARAPVSACPCWQHIPSHMGQLSLPGKLWRPDPRGSERREQAGDVLCVCGG